MKTVKWTATMDDVKERFCDPNGEEDAKLTYDQWCEKRCKMMLQDFYLDSKKVQLKTLSDLRTYIDKWVKIHFQY